MSLFEQLQEAISQTLRVPSSMITPTSQQEEIAAWDSVGHVNLMMALEQTFDIQLEVEDFPTLNSVPAMTAYLESRGIR